MKISQYIQGYVRIEITGVGTERFLNICTNNQITLYAINIHELSIECIVKASDFKKLKSPCRIARVHIKIIDKKGLPFIYLKNKTRYFFMVGIIIFISIYFFMSRHIWRITVNGTSFYSEESIYDFLKEKNITNGVRKDAIACQTIEEDIRKAFDDISWVSADINGVVLNINIKEITNKKPVDAKDSSCDICASKSGIIESIITRIGTPIVKAGDEVVAGDVLVMSKVESKNESEEVFNTRYVNADADILIRTEYIYNDTVQRNYDMKEYTGKEHITEIVRIGNRIFQNGFKKCDFELYDVYTDYSPVKMYESAILPVIYENIHYKEYTLTPAVYSDEEMTGILQANLDKYIKNLQENSIQIVSDSVKINTNASGASAEGTITVIEAATTTAPPVIDEPKGTEENELN